MGRRKKWATDNMLKQIPRVFCINSNLHLRLLAASVFSQGPTSVYSRDFEHKREV